MAKVTGGQLLIRALKAEGVDTMFGLNGTAVLGVFDACIDEGMRIIDGRHEAALVHMAEGYARAKAAPGVAIVTEGPGHANAMPGLACAWAERSPVLLLNGIAESTNLGKGALQEIPQVEMATPITKWSAMVPSAQRIPEFVATAFRHLRNGEPGPVSLTLPVDRLDHEPIDEADAPIIPSTALGPTGRAGAEPQLIGEAIRLLAQAERPAILAGSVAHWSRAGDALRDFVELTRIPLFTTGRARGLVSDDHPLCFGANTPAGNEPAQVLRSADVLVILGERMDLLFTRALPPDAQLIHVYPNPAEVGKSRQVAVGIPADAKATLEQLTDAAKQHSWPELSPWLESLQEARARREESRKQDAPLQTPVHPLQVAKEVEPFVDKGTLVTEATLFASWSQGYLKVRRPGQWQQSTTLFMIGTGVPYAIGTKVASPESNVLLLSGDGSFGFYPMEFDTAVRHNLPFVAVVGNDAGWGIEQKFQAARFGKDRMIATKLLPSRYDKLVEALGGHGEYVQKPEELGPALQRAFASGKPACVNVITESAVSPGMTQTVANMAAQRQARLAGTST